MDNEAFYCVPTLTHQAGSTLTADNWLNADIHIAVCALDALLIKPGYECLLNLPDLKTYFAWPGKLILNASMLVMSKKGDYTLKSPYDGCIIKINLAELLALVQILKPNYLVLPKNSTYVLNELPKEIFPFIDVNDISQPVCSTRYGISFQFDDSKTSIHEFTQSLKPFGNFPLFVQGNIKLQDLKVLVQSGITFLDANLPITQAYNGYVYTNEKEISILSDEWKFEFEPIDKNCQCPVCQQGLTKAYLHHLFVHTPLLCQRFLIQHNLHYCQNLINS